ncbi:MAG TPA: hypothetical protein VHD90_18610 [Phototrophicaceae bacterium]|nr:hypothetical protein [Phototrophicaceae bacterium]
MSEQDSAPQPSGGSSVPNLEERIKQRQVVSGIVLEQLKPWLFEFGSWIFGGLLAFNLILIGPLLTLGPIHPALLIAIAMLACALPLDVLGLFLLRLINDINGVAIEEVMKQAFIDANVPDAEDFFSKTDDQAARSKRRTDAGLRYAPQIAAVSIALTVIGLIAALWYVAWWIGVLFIVMVIVCVVLAINVFNKMMPPYTEEERKQRQQQREQIIQQSKNQQKTK